jgi:hypothetical protein
VGWRKGKRKTRHEKEEHFFAAVSEGIAHYLRLVRVACKENDDKMRVFR